MAKIPLMLPIIVILIAATVVVGLAYILLPVWLQYRRERRNGR